MNRERCQRYLEDPEANAAHLLECAGCRAIAEGLQTSDFPSATADVHDLPFAPWEGAAHRSWPLVLAGAVAVVLAVWVLFAATGTSPLTILHGRLPSAEVIASMGRLAGGAVRNAPVRWQVAIGVLFVVVNGILIALLRREPRGLDV
ncbi:MAG: hypothetical protein NVSMB68_10650 [Thermoanaerobaculia bacterium]